VTHPTDRAIHRVAACMSALAALLCLCTDATAQDLSDIPGAFVDVGIGTREMGMGGASVASSKGPTAVFWNPARLAAPETRDGLALTHGDVMGLVPYSAAAGVKRVGTDWAFAAGMLYSGDDALSEMTVILSAATSLQDPAWLAEAPMLVGLSARLRRASFGGDGGESSGVTGDALGAALDAGVVCPISEGARLAVTGRDIVGVLHWDSSASGTYEEGVPPGLTFGIAVDVGEHGIIEADLDKALSLDGRDLLVLGAEADIFHVATVRVGYRRALQPHELEEFSLGGGVSVSAACAELDVDVAYLFARLDDTLRLSVGFRF